MEFTARKGRDTVLLRRKKTKACLREVVGGLETALSSKEPWTVGSEAEVQGWVKSISKTVAAIEGYSPEGRRSKRQQKDKLKSRAYRAARAMKGILPMLIGAIILSHLDLGIEGLELAGLFFTPPDVGPPHALKQLNLRFRGTNRMKRVFENLIDLFDGENQALCERFGSGEWLAMNDDGALLIVNCSANTWLTLPMVANRDYRYHEMPVMRATKALSLAQEAIAERQNAARRHLAEIEGIRAGQRSMRMTPMGAFMGKMMEGHEIPFEEADSDVIHAAMALGWVELDVVTRRRRQIGTISITNEGYSHWLPLVTEAEEVKKKGWAGFFVFLLPIVILFGAWLCGGLGEWAVAFGFTSLKPLRGAKWMEEDDHSILKDERDKAAWMAQVKSTQDSWKRFEGFEEAWEEFGGKVAKQIPIANLYEEDGDEAFVVGVMPSPIIVEILRMDPPRAIVQVAIEAERLGQLPREKKLIECWMDDQYSILDLSPNRRVRDGIQNNLYHLYRLKWAEHFTSKERLGMAGDYSNYSGLYWRALARVIQETITPEQKGRVSVEEWERFLASPPMFFWGINSWISNSRYYFHYVGSPADMITFPSIFSSDGEGWLRFLRIKREHGEALAAGIVKKLADVGSCYIGMDEVQSKPHDILQLEEFLEDVMHLADNKQGKLGTLLFKKEFLGEKMPARKEWKSLLSLLSKAQEQDEIFPEEAWRCLSICRKASVTKALLELSGQGMHQLLSLLLPLEGQKLKHHSKWLEFLCRNGSRGLKLMSYFQVLELAGCNPSQSLEELIEALKEIISPEVMDLFLLGAPIDEESVKWHRDLMLRAVPGPLPAETLVEEPGYRLRVLAHDDLTGPCLGFVITCCQKYKGLGVSCAEFGATSSSGGFVVLEKKEKTRWRIIAQSFYWVDSKSKGLCFDNIELQQKLVYVPIIRRLYTQAAEHILTKGYKVVTLGAEYSADGLLDGFAIAHPLTRPSRFYTDADCQVVLAGSLVPSSADLDW
jgi:hypothetical protein